MLFLEGDGSLQQQVAAALRKAIMLRELAAGVQLLSSRALALELGVSRNTVIAAYEQLGAEGYVETRKGSGTFVVGAVQTRSEIVSEKGIAPVWSRYGLNTLTQVSDQLAFRTPRRPLRYNFLYGEPGYADLPIERWARIIGKKARELTEKQLGYAPTGGVLELRVALADYLRRSRGVRCAPEQVFLVQGTQEAIDLVTRVFVDPGARAVIEEPHYRGFERCLLAVGARIAAIPVDDEGLQTEHLQRVKRARIAFVTPSHQFPYGSVMSMSRRAALLDWAVANDTVVFEDDYDSEFRYEGRPIPSVQSLDQNGCVIYVGTASKILFPSLRLGWMVIPQKMVEGFERFRTLSDTNPSTLEQLAFAEFVSSGYLERHVHQMRKRHSARRAALLESLGKELGNRVHVVGTDAGIHVLLRLPEICASKTAELIHQVSLENVGVYPTNQYYLQEAPKCAELILGYASLTPGQIKTGIKRLAKVINQLSAAS
jgi:GntR family transcriptional regulator/MocR family aminotransferase